MFGTPSSAHCQEKMPGHERCEFLRPRPIGMELYKSQRVNLAVPPRDFLVFAWRPFILAACVSHRVRGVIEINIRLSYFVAGSAESISFPWHCYLTYLF